MQTRSCSSFLYPALPQLTRHARHSGPAFGRPEHNPCAGHPRLHTRLKLKTWMAGTSPAMTTITLALAVIVPSAPTLSQPIEVPPIVIYASQVPTEASRVGASVTVLGGNELRSKGVASVAEALRTVPGVAVSQSGTRGTLTQIRIRGSEARHVLVLIDGIEANRLDGTGFDFADMPVDDL